MTRPSLFTVIVVYFGCTATVSQADVLPTDWWSNQTASSGIVEQGNEGLRMTTGFNTGFLEGTVDSLPGTEWVINFHVATDGDVDLPDEYVDIFVDGKFVNRIHNTPTGTHYFFDYAFSGDSFDYRFEFSSPTTEITDHLIVNSGTVTSIPEPAALALSLGTIVFASVLRTRNTTR